MTHLEQKQTTQLCDYLVHCLRWAGTRGTASSDTIQAAVDMVGCPHLTAIEIWKIMGDDYEVRLSSVKSFEVLVKSEMESILIIKLSRISALEIKIKN